MARKDGELVKAAAGAAAAAGVAAAAGAIAVKRRSHEPRSYRLLEDEPVPEGIRRIARGRIDSARDELHGKTDSSPEEAVHEARKDLKKLRSLLRLIRLEIGNDVYRRESDCFRDAGRKLSGVRDADVMLETLESLAEDLPDGAVDGLREALEAHRASLVDEEGRKQKALEVVQMLADARDRVDEWPLATDGFGAIEPGLRRGYRRGRRRMRAARKEPSTEAFHEWRKRSKDLWYHVTILREAWEAPLKAYADEAHELSNRLGDDHDLAVLLEWTHGRAIAVGGSGGRANLEGVAEERRAQLQREAFALGGLLYAERPKDFSARMRRLWGATRPEAVAT